MTGVVSETTAPAWPTVTVQTILNILLSFAQFEREIIAFDWPEDGADRQKFGCFRHFNRAEASH